MVRFTKNPPKGFKKGVVYKGRVDTRQKAPTATGKLIKLAPGKGSKGPTQYFIETKTGQIKTVSKDVSRESIQQVETQAARARELETGQLKRQEAIVTMAERQGRQVIPRELAAIRGGEIGPVQAREYERERIISAQQQLKPYYPGGVSAGFAQKYMDQQKEIFKIQQQEFTKATGLPKPSTEFMQLYAKQQKQIREIEQKEGVIAAIVGKEAYRDVPAEGVAYGRKLIELGKRREKLEPEVIEAKKKISPDVPFTNIFKGTFLEKTLVEKPKPKEEQLIGSTDLSFATFGWRTQLPKEKQQELLGIEKEYWKQIGQFTFKDPKEVAKKFGTAAAIAGAVTTAATITATLYPKTRTILPVVGVAAASLYGYSVYKKAEAQAKLTKLPLPLSISGEVIKESPALAGLVVGGFAGAKFGKIPARYASRLYTKLSPKGVSWKRTGVKLIEDYTIPTTRAKLKALEGKTIPTIHATASKKLKLGVDIKPADVSMVSPWRAKTGQLSFYQSAPQQARLQKLVKGTWVTTTYKGTPIAPRYDPILYGAYTGIGKGPAPSALSLKYAFGGRPVTKAFIFRQQFISPTPPSIISKGLIPTVQYQTVTPGTYIPAENILGLSTEGQVATSPGLIGQPLFTLKPAKGPLSGKFSFYEYTPTPPIKLPPILTKPYKFLTTEAIKIKFFEAQLSPTGITTGLIDSVKKPPKAIDVVSSPVSYKVVPTQILSSFVFDIKPSVTSYKSPVKSIVSPISSIKPSVPPSYKSYQSLVSSTIPISSVVSSIPKSRKSSIPKSRKSIPPPYYPSGLGISIPRLTTARPKAPSFLKIQVFKGYAPTLIGRGLPKIKPTKGLADIKFTGLEFRPQIQIPTKKKKGKKLKWPSL